MFEITESLFSIVSAGVGVIIYFILHKMLFSTAPSSTSSSTSDSASESDKETKKNRHRLLILSHDPETSTIWGWSRQISALVKVRIHGKKAFRLKLLRILTISSTIPIDQNEGIVNINGSEAGVELPAFTDYIRSFMGQEYISAWVGFSKNDTHKTFDRRIGYTDLYGLVDCGGVKFNAEWDVFGSYMIVNDLEYVKNGTTLFKVFRRKYSIESMRKLAEANVFREMLIEYEETNIGIRPPIVSKCRSRKFLAITPPPEKVSICNGDLEVNTDGSSQSAPSTPASQQSPNRPSTIIPLPRVYLAYCFVLIDAPFEHRLGMVWTQEGDAFIREDVPPCRKDGTRLLGLNQWAWVTLERQNGDLYVSAFLKKAECPVRTEIIKFSEDRFRYFATYSLDLTWRQKGCTDFIYSMALGYIYLPDDRFNGHLGQFRLEKLSTPVLSRCGLKIAYWKIFFNMYHRLLILAVHNTKPNVFYCWDKSNMRLLQVQIVNGAAEHKLLWFFNISESVSADQQNGKLKVSACNVHLTPPAHEDHIRHDQDGELRILAWIGFSPTEYHLTYDRKVAFCDWYGFVDVERVDFPRNADVFRSFIVVNDLNYVKNGTTLFTIHKSLGPILATEVDLTEKTNELRRKLSAIEHVRAMKKLGINVENITAKESRPFAHSLPRGSLGDVSAESSEPSPSTSPPVSLERPSAWNKKAEDYNRRSPSAELTYARKEHLGLFYWQKIEVFEPSYAGTVWTEVGEAAVPNDLYQEMKLRRRSGLLPGDWITVTLEKIVKKVKEKEQEMLMVSNIIQWEKTSFRDPPVHLKWLEHYYLTLKGSLDTSPRNQVCNDLFGHPQFGFVWCHEDLLEEYAKNKWRPVLFMKLLNPVDTWDRRFKAHWKVHQILPIDNWT
ncbi:unnamed protein product [Caenorhabditis sp. 36 PRJEB53466]|nr:unnamed protein product [Caenorhabditis sp. 36 PRJEB53466]